MTTQREAFVPRATVSWRAVAKRFSSFLLAAAAIFLIVLGRINSPLIERVRTRADDMIVPLLALAQRPVATIRGKLDETRGLLDLAAENARLRDENTRLREWQAAAFALEGQNHVLRGMIALDPPPTPVVRTEPIIAEPGGVYVRSLLIGGGSHDGLGRGQAAMVGSGLIGRITEIGAWSARVLLITDLNSRIPVMLEGSRARAILAGDNSARPYLLYMPKAAQIAVGDRVATAGHDGVFPTGLAVGRVASVQNGEIRVEPFADLDRLEYVTLVDSVAQSALTPEVAPSLDPRGPPGGR